MEHDFALKTKAKNQSKTKINTSESRCNTYVRKEYMGNELGWEYGNQSVLHLCHVVVPLTLQFRDALHPAANDQRIGKRQLRGQAALYVWQAELTFIPI